MTHFGGEQLEHIAACLKHELEAVPAKHRKYRFSVTKESWETLDRIAGTALRRVSAAEDAGEEAFRLRKSLGPLLGQNPPNYELARWIVTSWGGIGKADNDEEKQKRFREVIARAEKWAEAFLAGATGSIEFNRVASWSKYLAFRHPAQFAIYDSRVAYSLNWLLHKCKWKGGFFPFPPGQNALLSALGYELVLACRVMSPQSVKEQLAQEVDDLADWRTRSRLLGRLRDRVFIGRDESYAEYCRLAKEIGAQMYGDDPWGLTRVEMMLFSMAPYVGARIFEMLHLRNSG